MCVDFTSAHHLDWGGGRALTTGRPAALDEGLTAPVEHAVAELTGLERGIASRSTIHAGWDLGTVLGGRETAWLVDDGAYPTTSVAVSSAAARGSMVVPFRHHDVASLERAVRRAVGRRPVVVTDGWCPGCGGPAPLAGYHDVAARARGVLLVDDTQALGVLGPRGGGTVPAVGVCCAHVIAVSSLAKGFAAPMAVTTGPAGLIDRVRTDGPARSSSSPPTRADIAAARRSLHANAVDGDHRRARLRSLVCRFRRRALAAGLPVIGGEHPAQGIGPLPGATTMRAHHALTQRGFGVVPQRLRCRRGSALTFLISVRHRTSDIDRAVAAVDLVLRGGSHGRVA